MTDPHISARRLFIKRTLGVLASLPLVGAGGCAVSGGGGSRSQLPEPSELPILNPSETAATGLGYETDVARVEPSFNRGQDEFCRNCGNFSQIGEGDEWGTCSVFPGRRVNVDGWCKRWQPTRS